MGRRRSHGPPPAPGNELLMHQQPNQRATGHVYIVRRKHGPQYYMKYRLPDGQQVQKKLGPAWTGKGRPAAGHYTRKTAEEALQAILTDARRGTLDTVKTGA